MLLMFLLTVLVLLGIFIVLAACLTISKAINGVFLGMFGNLFYIVKTFCILKKIIIIGIIFRLFSMEKRQRKANEKAD
ncbi:MAG: hypothetical protein J6Y20_05510 [Lachnospiraceae bacterium]|nr:hypothetical protein [Lachnospiraceae bacterium]